MSRFINGRTYRDVLTTNNLPEPAKVEPAKLNQVTTAVIPNAAPRPQPVGDGFKKMITTNDEPNMGAERQAPAATGDEGVKLAPAPESPKKESKAKKS